MDPSQTPPQDVVPSLSDQGAAVIVTVGLLAALVIFTLATLPRSIAMIASLDSWTYGWRLRDSSQAPAQRERDRDPKLAVKKPSSRPRISRHRPALATTLYPIASVLKKRLAGYSFGQLLILIVYAALFSVGLFLNSSPVSNYTRAGWIAMSQIPVIVALASKNSIIGALVGVGYEKLNYIHRWIGRLMFIAVLFHVISPLVMWTQAGILASQMTQATQIWGCVAIGGLSLIVFGSLPVFRQRFRSIFSYAHWIGFVVLLIGLSFHADAGIPSVSLGIYALDQILRLVRARYVTATIRYIPELKSTQVVIPSLTYGWRAGQHVRLSVISTAMGFRQVIESHPFTIATTNESEDGIILYCSEAGDWTKSLAMLARSGVGHRQAKESEMGQGQNIKVLIQGPYGGPGNAVFSSFSAALFICGGGGITFGLGAIEEVIRNSLDGSSQLRIVSLVWVVQDPTAIFPLFSTFTRLVQQAQTVTSISFQINIHYTRATSNTVEDTVPLPDGVTLNPGRPDLAKLLGSTCDSTIALKDATKGGVNGVVVGVCGPDGLLDGVRRAEANIGMSVRSAIGGVELVEEAFVW